MAFERLLTEYKQEIKKLKEEVEDLKEAIRYCEELSW